MDYIFAKLSMRATERLKYRRILATQENVFPECSSLIINAVDYSPETILDDDSHFRITEFSNKEYCNSIIQEPFTTSDFEQLTQDEYAKIDYLFVSRDDCIMFQKVSKTKLVSKKGILYLGERFTYNSNYHGLRINSFPDAIYIKEEDTLYFRRLEAITSIFRGISELYREATNEEVEDFLREDFIQIENGFSSFDVKTSNRKRIALALKTLHSLSSRDKQTIFAYIHEYCPELNDSNGCFVIDSENALKNLLYGIEQRFYTTPIGNEKRLANSVVSLSTPQRENMIQMSTNL